MLKYLKVKIGSEPIARSLQLYWAAHQRFFRSLIIGSKVTEVVSLTKYEYLII